MRYKVVLVPFPFDDLSGSKVRPAVCLTATVGTHRHVVLAFITSAVPPKLEPTDVLLDPGSPELCPHWVASPLGLAPASHGHGFCHDYSAAVGCPDPEPDRKSVV